MEFSNMILNSFMLELQCIQIKSAIREAVSNSLHLPDNGNLFVEGRLSIRIPGELTTFTLSFTDDVNSEIRSQSSGTPSELKANPLIECIGRPLAICSDDFRNTIQTSPSDSISPTSMIDCALDLTKGTSVPSALQETPVKQGSFHVNEMIRLFQQNLFPSTCLPLFQPTTTLPTISPGIQHEPCSVTPSPKKRRRVEIASVRKKDEFRQFRCNQCDGIFNSLRNLESHTQEMHGGYKCHLCQKTFTQRSNLQRHALKHVDFKPFECSLCEKGYNRKDHLMRHMQKAHPFDSIGKSIRVKLRTSESLDYLRQTGEDEYLSNICYRERSSINESLQMEDSSGTEDGELAVIRQVTEVDVTTIESPVKTYFGFPSSKRNSPNPDEFTPHSPHH